MSQGGDGIHHLSRGMTVAENLSMGVNQGNYYVLGGYGKFFLHRGVFLFTGIAHCQYNYTTCDSSVVQCLSKIHVHVHKLTCINA